MRAGGKQHDGGGERCECEQGQLECTKAGDAGDSSLPLQPRPSQGPVVDAEASGNVRRAVDAAAGDDRPGAQPKGNVRPAVHPRDVTQGQHVADVAGDLCADADGEPARVEVRRDSPNRAQTCRVGHKHAGDHRQRGRGREDDQIRARLRRLHTTSIDPDGAREIPRTGERS